MVAKGIHKRPAVEAAKDLPATARPAVDMLADQLRETQEKIDDLTARIEAAQKTDPLAKRLATIPGVGTLTASAIAASCQRHASGVTPEVDNLLCAGLCRLARADAAPHSSGGKERLGRISKAGNRYLRRLLYLGASCRRHAFGVRRRSVPGMRKARYGLALAHAGEKAREGRRRRAGEPHGAGRLGADPKRRELPGHPGLTGHAGLPAGSEMVRRVTPKACLRHDVR